MKVCFWIKCTNKPLNIDQVEKGNPGIGGTEYLILLVAYEIQKRLEDIQVTLYTNNKNLEGASLVIKYTEKADSMVIAAVNDEQDILVFTQGNVDDQFYDTINKTNLKAIAWVHNYLTYNDYNKIVKSMNIKKVVFVGQQLYDHYIDDKIIEKSLYIFNCVPELEPCKRENDANSVVFCGGLIHQKGFWLLAKSWKKIVHSCPDAHLYVLGGGLYKDVNEEKYIKYVTDNQGKVLDSVSFEGLIGADRKKYYEQCAVGVANPTGKTETFCLSAVEFEQQGIPVVTYNGYGLLDTVKEGLSGYRIRGWRKLSQKVIELLKNGEKNKIMGENGIKYVKEHFTVELIVPEWDKLFKIVNKNDVVQNMFSYKNYWDDFKWLRYINWKFQQALHLRWCSIQYFQISVKYFLKKVLNNIMR